MTLKPKFELPSVRDIKVPSLSKMKELSLNRIQVPGVVFVAGILTFLYLVEVAIGMRTIYYAFHLWNSTAINQSKVSWALCVVCLLVCVTSIFTVGLVSALWEKKQMQEESSSPYRFACHLAVGGILWRYVSLCCSDQKDQQERGALLLAMAKFLFTQVFTVPVVIVHVGLLDDLDEVVFVVCSVLCISLNLLMTSLVFCWCEADVAEVKKWGYETANLVPLIFGKSSEEDNKEETKTRTADEEERDQGQCTPATKESMELTLVRVLVLLQTFSFSLGRLLALGVLLKLAGIYAASIMCLQLLISVIYLKFQVPMLVSDSLPKWRQLMRLAFMSYILIFEWHLNRDPRTGYDFVSNIKHSMFYYCIAALESVFYLITWAVTSTYAMHDEYLFEIPDFDKTFVQNIILIGTFALVFSLILHVVLIFWQSTRWSRFLSSVHRTYLRGKLKMSGNNSTEESDFRTASQKTDLETSDPTPIESAQDSSVSIDENESQLEKHNSYRDLREPLDEEIEIYVRRNEQLAKNAATSKEKFSDHPSNIDAPKTIHNAKSSMITKESLSARSCRYVPPAKADDSNNDSVFPNASKTESRNLAEKSKTKIPKRRIGKNDAPSLDESQEETPKAINDVDLDKPNVSKFPRSVSEHWNTFSTLSHKITDNVVEKIQKGKQQIKNYREKNTGLETDEKNSTEVDHNRECPENSVRCKKSTSNEILRSPKRKLNKNMLKLFKSNENISDETIPVENIKFTTSRGNRFKAKIPVLKGKCSLSNSKQNMDVEPKSNKNNQSSSKNSPPKKVKEDSSKTSKNPKENIKKSISTSEIRQESIERLLLDDKISAKKSAQNPNERRKHLDCKASFMRSMMSDDGSEANQDTISTSSTDDFDIAIDGDIKSQLDTNREEAIHENCLENKKKRNKEPDHEVPDDLDNSFQSSDPDESDDMRDEAEVKESTTEMPHEEDSSCPCFVCKTAGDTTITRRRSSSVPSSREEASQPKETLDRCPSSPSVVRVDIADDLQMKGDVSVRMPRSPVRTVVNLSLLSKDDRMEHFV